MKSENSFLKMSVRLMIEKNLKSQRVVAKINPKSYIMPYSIFVILCVNKKEMFKEVILNRLHRINSSNSSYLLARQLVRMKLIGTGQKLHPCL